MKRIVRMLLALLLLLPAALFATGGSEGAAAPAKKVDLRYWTLFAGGDGETMGRMVKAFNDAHPNIQVEFNITQWENYYAQLTAAIAGGNAPDIAIVHTRNLPAFASEQFLYTFDEALAKKGIGEKDFLPLAWNGGSIGGKRYGVPLDVIVAMVLFYNTDLYAKAGLKEAPKSGAEFVDYARRIKAATGVWGTAVPLMGFNFYRYWFASLYQNGGEMLTADLKKAAFNTPAGAEALQYWVDVVHKHQVAPNKPLGEGEGFLFGKQGMDIQGIWANVGFRAKPELKFDVFAMPTLFKPGNRSFFANSHNWVLPKPKQVDAARRDASMEFVLWMSANSRHWTEGAAQLVARKSIVDDPKYIQLPYMKTLLDQVPYAKYPPAIKATNEVQNAIIKALDLAMAQKLTAAEAMAQAEADVNKVLAQ